MKVAIVGIVRGFFQHLIYEMAADIEFSCQENTYEVPKKYKIVISKLLKTKLVGVFGIFRVVRCKNLDETADCYLSFNRFMHSDKPYYIFLENPTALCNYSLTCLASPFVKKRLKALINDEKFIKFICMSKACENTVEKVLGVEIPKHKICQIYPYVRENLLVNKVVIQSRSTQESLKLLYVVQGERFFSKGGLEVIKAYKNLRKKYDISLTVITNINKLDPAFVAELEGLGVVLWDFHFSYGDMEQIYATHHILLQPSSDDSFGLTVLEAIKAGLAIISSDLYAFKEMVHNGENGFLVIPSYRFFDEENMPNPSVWNRRKKTIYSGKLNEELVLELCEKIEILHRDREMLQSFSLSSLNYANTEFGKEKLFSKWKTML